MAPLSGDRSVRNETGVGARAGVVATRGSSVTAWRSRSARSWTGSSAAVAARSASDQLAGDAAQRVGDLVHERALLGPFDVVAEPSVHHDGGVVVEGERDGISHLGHLWMKSD